MEESPALALIRQAFLMPPDPRSPFGSIAFDAYTSLDGLTPQQRFCIEDIFANVGQRVVGVHVEAWTPGWGVCDFNAIFLEHGFLVERTGASTPVHPGDALMRDGQAGYLARVRTTALIVHVHDRPSFLYKEG